MEPAQKLIDVFLTIPDADRAQAFVNFVSAVVTANRDPKGTWAALGKKVKLHIAKLAT